MTILCQICFNNESEFCRDDIHLCSSCYLLRLGASVDDVLEEAEDDIKPTVA